MIELIQAPAASRVIADGNDTLIKINSSSSGDYFLRASIYVDGAADPFLSQAWSKDEAGSSVFNLRHLYYAYFENKFTPEITPGFNQLQGLMKKIKITLQEFRIGSSLAIDTLHLPEFYLIKNHKPQIFNDSITVAFLDLPQNNIKASRSGSFIFPLFLKAGPGVTVRILDDKQAELSSSSLQNISSQITAYHLDFSQMALDAYPFIYVKFETSQHSVQKKIIFIQETVYPVKEIFYQNNFGIYCQAYLTGRKKLEHDLSPMSYAQYDGSEVTYDVGDNKSIELNSGFGYADITELIHAIARSLDVRIDLGEGWERVKSETKSVTKQIDNQFIYGDVLKFSRLNLPNYTNDDAYGIMPEISDLIVSGNENERIEITKAQLLDQYIGTQSASRLKLRALPQNGKLSFEDDQGVTQLSDLAAYDPSIIPYTISLANLIKINYDPDVTEFGAPLDSIGYEMGPDVMWSNTAYIRFNVIEIPEANLPPSIKVNSIQNIAIDGSGNGSKQILADIYDPDGDPISILWEALNGAPVTFDDASLASPTITLTGSAAGSAYEVKVTATDTANNLISSKTITIYPASYELSITKLEGPDNYDTKTATITISGGQPGGSVRIKRQIQAFDFQQYVIWNFNLPNERIFTTNISEEDVILDGSGALEIPVQIRNQSVQVVVSLQVDIISADGDQLIGPNDSILITYLKQEY